MAIRMTEAVLGGLPELRYEPIQKRIRAIIGGQTVLDSTGAMVVWEPKRVTPNYAVPQSDIAGELAPATRPTASQAEPLQAPHLGARPVYDPSVPFAVHTADGEPLDLNAAGAERPGAAFRPSDPALAGWVILDFAAFDAWYEEDERNVGHPRDPFHRIEILHSSRHVRVELDGRLLAETDAPYLLSEAPLPPRYYLPADAIVPGALEPSETRSTCAYKGHASYWSAAGAPDIAWGYPEPLREASEIAGRIAFFNERVQISVDGVPLARSATPWTRR